MDSAQHDRVMQVLGDALELDPQRRSDFVREACGLDKQLRAEVERLLLGSGKATAAIPTAHGSAELVRAMLPPQQIGPYKLVRQLGEGGMGVVYLAVQDQPVRRTVALKLIRPGMDSREVVARFESERQALALMSHPNVAHVYDAGATATGRPYFVMEYVDGEPITDWCDAHRIPLRPRLELFCHVCDAVQHAHQKGIVHRDLKPTNVLIAGRDDQPIPKVIDFGIAKAMEQRLTEHSLLTELGQLVGTPEYMSPEQAANSADIDTRTDVYALGVLLYELLSGVLPFDRKMLRSSAYDEMRRIIREVDALRPSSRIASLDSDQTRRIAEARKSQPLLLRRALAGELDWIVMKSLEKDRERRYASPSDLAADVQRHLRDEPVSAGPPTATYRIGKFARRHRAAVLAGLLVLAALVGGMATTTWQAIRARRAERAIRIEQQRTLEQKTLAEQQKTIAEQQKSFAEQQKALAEKRFNDVRKLAGSFMFEVDETLQAAGPTKAREKLVNTAIEYLDALSKETPDPALARELVQGYLHVGSVQYYPGAAHLGDMKGALKTYQKAMEIAQKLAREHPDDVDALMLVGGCWIFLAEVQADLDDSSTALESFDQARKAYDRAVQLDPKSIMPRRNIGVVHEKLAHLYLELGRGDDSQINRQQSLKVYESLLEEDPNNPLLLRDVALAHNGLGNLLMERGRLSEALPHGIKAMDLSEAQIIKTPDSPWHQRDVMLHSKDAAHILLLLGHANDAIKPARRALEMSSKMVDADPPNQQARRDLAGSYATLGEVLLESGHCAEAVEMLRRCLRIRAELMEINPEDRRLVVWNANARTALAAGLRSSGNLGEALAEAQAAAAAREDLVKAEPQNFARVSSLIESLSEVGQILLEQNRPQEALEYLEKAIGLRPPAPRELKTPPVDWRYMLPFMIQLSDAREQTGKLAEAADACDEVIRLAQPLLEADGGDDWVRAQLASALARRGILLLRQNELEEASDLIDKALVHARQVASNAACGITAHEALWQAQVAGARLHAARGQDTEAQKSWRAALDTAHRLAEADPQSARFRKLVDQTVAWRDEHPATRPSRAERAAPQDRYLRHSIHHSPKASASTMPNQTARSSCA